MNLRAAKQPRQRAGFWRSTEPPPADARVLWVGAGTKDTGFSLTRLTFKITHATDADTNIERDFIITELSSIHVIGEPICVSRRAALVRSTSITT